MLKRIFLLAFISVLLVGCTIANNKSCVIFSDQPINQNNMQNMSNFKTGKRIYFAILMKDGFEDDMIHYQLIKKDTKVQGGGYKIVYATRERVEHKNYYLNYIVPSQAGTYILEVFELRNLHEPIVFGGFTVCD